MSKLVFELIRDPAGIVTFFSGNPCKRGVPQSLIGDRPQAAAFPGMKLDQLTAGLRHIGCCWEQMTALWTRWRPWRDNRRAFRANVDIGRPGHGTLVIGCARGSIV
jgi:hypothetical protein